MPATPSSLALAVLLSLAQEEAPPPKAAAEAPVEAPAASEPAPEAAPESQQISRITLKDGQVLHGVVVSQDSQRVVVELAQGSRMELPAAAVEKVETEKRAMVRKNGAIWFQDPNRTRYLYAPTGMMLRAGEGYVSQKELVFTSAAYGLTDNVTLLAGAAVPAWFVPNGLNFIGGIKVGGSVSEKLHLAGGAQALVLPGIASGQPGAVGFLFATGTYGTPDAHLSLGVGIPFAAAANMQDVFGDYFVTTLSGNLRVGKHLSLVTENWAMPRLYQQGSQLPMLNSLALRFFGEQWAVDLGAIRVPYVTFPVPWLDFTYNFG